MSKPRAKPAPLPAVRPELAYHQRMRAISKILERAYYADEMQKAGIENFGPSTLLTTAQTARMLAVDARTLETWRRKGIGPAVVQRGGPVIVLASKTIIHTSLSASRLGHSFPGEGLTAICQQGYTIAVSPAQRAGG